MLVSVLFFGLDMLCIDIPTVNETLFFSIILTSFFRIPGHLKYFMFI